MADSLAGNSVGAVKRKPRGKPFQKGVSGNPTGRKPMPQEFKELAETYSTTALRKAIEIMESDGTAPKDKLKAIELIISYGIGKPTQPLDIESINKTDNTVTIRLEGDLEKWSR